MKRIIDPVEMRHLTLKNRLVRSATWEGIANSDGGITDEAYEIYEELAKGGVGAIIAGFTSAALNEADSQQHDIEFFMDELLKFSEITELDEVVTHRLIEKMIVEEPQIVDGEKI